MESHSSNMLMWNRCWCDGLHQCWLQEYKSILQESWDGSVDLLILSISVLSLSFPPDDLVYICVYVCVCFIGGVGMLVWVAFLSGAGECLPGPAGAEAGRDGKPARRSRRAAGGARCEYGEEQRAHTSTRLKLQRFRQRMGHTNTNEFKEADRCWPEVYLKRTRW